MQPLLLKKNSWRLRLYLICLTLLTSCAHAPKGPVCLVDVKSGGYQCSDGLTGRQFFKAFQDSDNDILLPQAFGLEFLGYCHGK